MSETNFTKLFSSITASTIWCESPETKIVWITMLAMSDAAGFVYASVPGLANIAQVPLKSTEEAIQKFLEPDEYSRDKSNDGVRIAEIDGGWAILNHPKYRKRRDIEERRTYHREYMRKKRAGSVNSVVKNVNTCEPQSTQGEAEAEEELKNVRKRTAPVTKFKQPNPKEVQKYLAEQSIDSFNGDYFCDYYIARGWQLSNGKQMKDWKAAVRTWKGKEWNKSKESNQYAGAI